MMNIKMIHNDVVEVAYHGFKVQINFESDGPNDLRQCCLVVVRHEDGTVLREYNDPPMFRTHRCELEVVRRPSWDTIPDEAPPN
jgi:hypothetical protein